MFGKQKRVTTRMAPSPTGHLHIGTARTALFNYLYTKNTGGTFILRIEDTDTERSTKAYEEEILEGLEWLGISWDTLYRQSERTDTYASYIERALRDEKAYTSIEESKKEPGVEVEVVRLRNPNKKISFEDEVRGEVTFDTTELGDFIIARSKTDPLYHLAVVVDDHEMEVTHVIRGEDHISNTPRQILIQEALGIERPIYAHLPLLLAPDRSKLSKRHGAVSVHEYKEAGYSKEALINYLALLGWNPGTNQEIFTMKELIEQFDLSGVQKSGAIFNQEKLDWVNKEHMKHTSDEVHFEMIQNRLSEKTKNLPQYSKERLSKILPTILERINVPKEITENSETGEYDFAFVAPPVDLDLLKWKKDSSARDALPRLQKVAELLSSLPEENTPEEIKKHLWDYAEEVGKGEVLWPLRVALTGQKQSPDPFTVIHIIGTGEAHKRVQHACDTILKA